MRDATRPMNRPLPPSHAIIAPPASGAFGFSAVQTLALKFLLPAAFPWTSPSEKLGIALPRMPTFRLPNFCAIYHPWALLKPPDRAWWLAGLGWVSPLPTDRQTRQPTSSPCTPHCSTSGIILYFFARTIGRCRPHVPSPHGYGAHGREDPVSIRRRSHTQ